jgi:hypothetical protein
MTLNQLLQDAARLPTVASLDDELRLIGELQALPQSEIGNNLDAFIKLVQVIQLSHADNGIFEMGEAEEAQAIGFFHWLQALEKTLGVPLTGYADGLDLTRAELAKSMPR